ncbi:MAG: flagellar biosynthesis protein FlhB, partial [Desulfobacula sp.]|nr:flagellar biosynthesis protein FlhB [Desulfobacula sp.]
MAEDPESGGEKTEDPTSRKLSKAREEGQVAKSIEIPSVFVLIAGVSALYTSAFYIYNNLVAVFNFNFNFIKIPLLTDLEVVRLLAYHIQKIVFTLIPVMIPIII